MIDWIDRELDQWGRWLRSADHVLRSRPESMLGKLVREPIVDHGTRHGARPVKWTDHDEAMDRVDKAVRKLSARQSTVMRMVYVKNFSQKMVAMTFRVTDRTVRNWIGDAHAELERRLEKPRRAA